MPENGQKPVVERALEIAVYAPVGLALYARDVLPPLVSQLVERGRTQVEQQVGQAKVVGRFAVSEGGNQVRRQVGERLHEARERGEHVARTVGLRPVPENGASIATRPSPRPAERSRTPARSDSGHLPIPDYDELSAQQVVARLSGLGTDDLEAVRDYERDHRQRKTILGKIDQLLR